MSIVQSFKCYCIFLECIDELANQCKNLLFLACFAWLVVIFYFFVLVFFSVVPTGLFYVFQSNPAINYGATITLSLQDNHCKNIFIFSLFLSFFINQ